MTAARSSRSDSRASPLLGLAIDIGTTKLAAYLVDLASGETRAQTGTMNPQIAHGEDVLTRIAYANTTPQRSGSFHDLLIEAIDEMTARLCRQAGAAPEAIVDAWRSATPRCTPVRRAAGSPAR